ncbi:MAG: Ig-like domain-containing protein [Turneriella sp.]|nr:Ig-like domain-containing protein [Turneriella sp.]
MSRSTTNLLPYIVMPAMALLASCKKLDLDANCLNPLAPCFKSDQTAPTLAGFTPLPNQGSNTVSVLTGIQITFSEEMKGWTEKSNYLLTNSNSGTLAIGSVSISGGYTVTLNLTGVVDNGPITVTFPGLSDYGGNKLPAGTAVNLTGNVDIPVKFAGNLTQITRYVSGVGGSIASANFTWWHEYTTDSGNNYKLKKGGASCSDPAAVDITANGSGLSGTNLAAGGENPAVNQITTQLQLANFPNEETYIVWICLDNQNMNKTGTGKVTVIRDNTPPTIIPSIGAGAYGQPQTVAFACNDNCNKIAYNIATGSTPQADPGAPTFTDTAGSTVSAVLSGTWLSPNSFSPTTYTTINLIAIDLAGNKSAPLPLSYTIDPNIPTISFGTPGSTHDYVSTTGYTSTHVNWQADQGNSYAICVGSTGCNAVQPPTCIGGTQLQSVNSMTSGGSDIAASSLAAGQNTIRICVKSAAQLGQATYTLFRDNNAPVLLATVPAENATGVLPNGTITVNFTEALGLDESTVTTNVNGDTTCSGRIQVSANNFSSCIEMVVTDAVNPTRAKKNSPTSYEVKPRFSMAPGQYKIRVIGGAGGIKDLAGNNLPATVVQTNGFSVIGLLRQFTFNNDAGDLVDQAQSGYNLTATGSPLKVTGVDGDANGAYKFDGTGNQYLTGSDSGLPAGNSPQTLCAWVNPAGAASGYAMAAAYGDTDWVYLGTHNGLRINAGHSGIGNTDGVGLPLNTWTHVCVAYSGTVQTVFVNGVVDNTQTPGGIRATTLNSLKIGKQSATNPAFSYFFHGRVDDVRVYAGSLSAADIRQMAIQVPNGLKAYYSFSDASGGTAIDYSGNGHTGTLVNAPIATADRFNVTGAYNFNSNTKAISASDTGLPAGTAPRTMCSWLRPTTLPVSGGYAIAAKYGQPMTGAANYVGIFNNAGNMNAIYSGWGDHLNVAYTFNANVWYHICGSYDGATARLYVNGQLIGQLAKSWNTVLIGSNGIMMGRGDATTSYPFSGDVDDVRIYNRVLADNEILALSSQLGIGLLRQYSFDGAAIGNSLTDDTGSGYNLTALGAPSKTTGFNGNTTGAVALNGATDYFSAADTGLPFANTPRTMCSWVNQQAVASVFALSYGDDNTGNASFIYTNTTGSGFGSYGAAGTYNLIATDAFPLNSWVFFCGVYDGTHGTIYLNGQIPTGGGPAPINFGTTSVGNFFIGARTGSSTLGFWNGSIDSVRIYNRALSAVEIKELQGY